MMTVWLSSVKSDLSGYRSIRFGRSVERCKQEIVRGSWDRYTDIIISVTVSGAMSCG